MVQKFSRHSSPRRSSKGLGTAYAVMCAFAYVIYKGAVWSSAPSLSSLAGLAVAIFFLWVASNLDL